MGADPLPTEPAREPAAEPIIRLEGVRRRFPVGLGLRRREVLHNVDLTVARGSALALVGPNGSGKSTLLRLMAGVDRASSGRLTVLGANPLSSVARARLAFLPEDSPFPGELTGMAVMELLGSLAGMRRAETRERARRCLERVGLADFAGARLRSYSRGMTRRFGLAQAFLADPELILLDEPTAGLDALGFGVLEGLVREARERGATIVLASHLLADVHEHCDRMALLIGGRIVAEGTPEELLGVEGRVRLEVDGLDEPTLARLEEWVREQGGRLVRRRPGGRSLLDLYLHHGAGQEVAGPSSVARDEADG